jgi:hypothetical protein
VSDFRNVVVHSISYALIRATKIVRGLSTSLTVSGWPLPERQLMSFAGTGIRWKLDEEVVPKGEVHSTPKSY